MGSEGGGGVRLWRPLWALGTEGAARSEWHRSKPVSWHSYTEYCQDNNHTGDADSTAGSVVARDEKLVGGKRREAGRIPPGRLTMG